MAQANKNISFTETTLKKIDEARAVIPRSTAINLLITNLTQKEIKELLK